VIRNLSFIEFSSGFSFSSYFSLVVLAYWVGCFLLGILLGLSLFGYSRVYISTCCSVLAFSFLYIENKKIYIFHFGIFSFGLFVIDIDTCIERLHLIEIAELN
jgi:hypothetical protein